MCKELKVYYLRNCSEDVGKIYYHSCVFEKEDSWNNPLPIGLAPYGSSVDYKPNKEEVLNFLKSRVIDENNQAIYDVMGSIGYDFYNLEALLDYTCGMSTDDYLWLVTEDKLHWDFDNYHIRKNPSYWENNNVTI